MISPLADKYHRAFLRVWLVADNTIANYFTHIWQLLNYKLTQLIEVTPGLFRDVRYVFIDVVDMDIIRLLCESGRSRHVGGLLAPGLYCPSATFDLLYLQIEFV